MTPETVRGAARRPRRRAARGLPLRRRARAPVRVRARAVRRPAQPARRQGRLEAARPPRRRGRRGARRRAGAARRRHVGRLRGGAAVSAGSRRAPRRCGPPSRTSPRSRAAWRADYLADDGLATALFFALRLPQPLLLEGEAGVGKTEAAKALAAALGHPADPPAVLRGHRRGRGALRVELPAAAAADPARRGGGRARSPRTSLFARRLPRRAAAAGGDRAPGAAAGGAADRRDRPRRRRLRGVPARAAGRVERHHPRDRHDAAPRTRRSSS